jgi:glucosamine 6-phosphate synthetase-like amidotransferase/phosphosugar isomerase protein
MCGIAGFHLSRIDGLTHSQLLAQALLEEIVVRGKDATGAAWLKKGDDKFEVWYSKQAVRAEKFIENGGLKEIPNKCKSVILHTRYATQGHKSNVDNNHPIIVDGIVGVHNGHVANDKQIISDGAYPRIGEVDSEAIFWEIAKSTHPTEGLQKIVGTAAVAWLEVDKPENLHLARCESSPLVVAQAPNGSVFFASTKIHLQKALAKCSISNVEYFEVPEWTYLKIHNGKIADWIDIPHAAKPLVADHWYASPNLPWNPSKADKQDKWALEDAMWESEQAAMRQFGWK